MRISHFGALLCTRHCVRHFLSTLPLTVLSKPVRYEVRSPFTDKETKTEWESNLANVTWCLHGKGEIGPCLISAEHKASPFPWHHVAPSMFPRSCVKSEEKRMEFNEDIDLKRQCED